MKVRDLMTPNPRTLDADATLGDAVAIMKRHKIRHLPILDGDEVVGVVSERDVKMALGPDASKLNIESIDPRQADGSVSWFMSEGVISVDANALAIDACDLFLEHRVGALAVLDGRELVGIVSVMDLLKASRPFWGGVPD